MNKLTRILTLVFGIIMIISGIVKIVGALAEEPVYEHIPCQTSIELSNGEGKPAATLAAGYCFNRKPGQIGVGYALTNHGALALTQLTFSVTYLDAGGNDLRGRQIEVLEAFMDDPVQPGETREFIHENFFDGAERAAAVALEPICVLDEAELAPWTEPRPHNLLLDFCNDPSFTACFENLDENPPVKMHFHVDQEVDEDITDPDEILATIERLRNMRIGDAVDYSVDDAGVSYWFTMADGTEWGVVFEDTDLFYWHGQNYRVEN